MLSCVPFIFALLAGAVTGDSPAPAAKGAAILTVQEIKVIAKQEPFHEETIHSEGVVTWVDQTAGKQFYIQDGTGGILVTFSHGDWPRMGRLVAVDGIITRGLCAAIITHGTFQDLGPGVMPSPISLMTAATVGTALVNSANNGKLVRIKGWVRAAEMITPDTLSIIMNSGASRVRARISNATGLNPKDLIAASIKLTGVASPIKAHAAIQRFVEAQQLATLTFPNEIPPYINQLVEVQILAADGRDLEVDTRLETMDPWSEPVVPLKDAFRYRAVGTRADRIHVRGQIIYRTTGMTYLADGTGGLAVRSDGIAPLRRGEWVDAVGFPDFEDSFPILSDAIIRHSGTLGGEVTPAEPPIEDLLGGLQYANYVKVTGRLLDLMRTPRPAGGERNHSAEKTLVLAMQSSHGVFTAELEESDGIESLTSRLEIGSTLQVSGICMVQTDMAGTPTSFKILVPGPGQVAILQPASFLTVKRLLIMLSITLGILLVVTLLTYFTARRNTRLRAEMHERQAVTAERSRLARDLHDTLEQGLTGVQLQLQSISTSRTEPSPETKERIRAVRSLIQQCHAEARRSIWNLRTEALEYFDLGEALERTARDLALGSGIQVKSRQQRVDGNRIPPSIEDNLLRIGQEALTNAVKHAQPSLLQIDLVVTSSQISLTIADDGRGGVEPTQPGHFGLMGMHERAERIGGQLIITNHPGAGCIVRVNVPVLSTA